MDLGLQGKSAIVCASSKGLGRACAQALANEGVSVVINGRDAARLAETAAAIRASTDVEVTEVVADLNSEEGRAALLAACDAPDILINNNGGPAPGRFVDWDRDAWLAGLEANLLAPVLMIRGVIEGMCERKFGRIVNVTSAMVKSPISVMGLSTAARSALTATCKGLSKEVAKDNVTINNLLPERIDTDRQKMMAEIVSKMAGITIEEARQQQIDSIAAGRLGTPEEFAAAAVFLCSANSGYISGQNLQVDGGSYDGLI
jgi:3-oxoacyl-[acyl-carrier protein] reductase